MGGRYKAARLSSPGVDPEESLEVAGQRHRVDDEAADHGDKQINKRTNALNVGLLGKHLDKYLQGELVS